jgi:acyl carrier protein
MTIISSRTPEGEPHQCPICDALSNLDPSYSGGDSCCPQCGHLLWWFQDRLGKDYGVEPADVLATAFGDLEGLDSMGTVELVMQIQEQLDVRFSDLPEKKLETVGELIRWIRKQQQEEPT